MVLNSKTYLIDHLEKSIKLVSFSTLIPFSWKMKQTNRCKEHKNEKMKKSSDIDLILPWKTIRQHTITQERPIKN
jgi:hypothetical protein